MVAPDAERVTCWLLWEPVVTRLSSASKIRTIGCVPNSVSLMSVDATASDRWCASPCVTVTSSVAVTVRETLPESMKVTVKVKR